MQASSSRSQALSSPHRTPSGSSQRQLIEIGSLSFPSPRPLLLVEGPLPRPSCGEDRMAAEYSPQSSSSRAGVVDVTRPAENIDGGGSYSRLPRFGPTELWPLRTASFASDAQVPSPAECGSLRPGRATHREGSSGVRIWVDRAPGGRGARTEITGESARVLRAGDVRHTACISRPQNAYCVTHLRHAGLNEERAV